MDFCEDAFIRPTKGARLIYYYYYYFGLCGSIPQFSDPAFDITSPLTNGVRFSFLVSWPVRADAQTHHATLPCQLLILNPEYYSDQPLKIP